MKLRAYEGKRVTVITSDGKKYYYKNDQVDTSYTGFAAYQGKKYEM